MKKPQPQRPSLIHSFNDKEENHIRSLKKLIILPFMAGILIALCIYTFFIIKIQIVDKEVARKQKILESLQKPSPTVRPTPTIVTPNQSIKIPVLMYHYVEYVKDQNDTIRKQLSITPYVFDYQMKTLVEEGYKTYYVKEVPGLLDGTVKLASRSAILTFDDGYQDFYEDVLPVLQKYGLKATLYVINNLVDSPGYITTDNLKAIVKSNTVEIGAHTLNHVYLKGAREATARNEIFRSKKELEDLLKIKVETFAYPYGAMDEQAIQLVKEASYSAAVSVEPGNVHTTDDLFTLYRIRAGAFMGKNMIQNIEKDFGKSKQ